MPHDYMETLQGQFYKTRIIGFCNPLISKTEKIEVRRLKIKCRNLRILSSTGTNPARAARRTDAGYTGMSSRKKAILSPRSRLAQMNELPH